MNEPTLRVENLSKRFCRSLKRSLWYGMKDLAGEVFFRGKERTDLRRHEFWALKDVSFEVNRGETMGLIGANGAGKSTLLKLINGLIKPDTGRISIRGRVGALISLGVGFNPVLTGRENIYVNAAVLGIRRREVDRLLDRIIDFAEIGDFIEAPVRTYSSGMKVRLGFSVAINMNPDLLLVDEVLAVGDSSFRQRCQERMGEYKNGGGTVIFVSHNSLAVEAMSDRVVLLDHGHVLEMGEPGEVIRQYESRALETSRQADIRLGRQHEMQGSSNVRITAVDCYNMLGDPKSEFEFGETFEVRVRYETGKDVRLPHFVVAIQKGTRHDPLVSMVDTIWDGIRHESIPTQGTVGCVIENPSLSPGSYRIQVGLLAQTTSVLGEKWHMPLTELGSFIVSPGQLGDRLPGVPTVQLVSRIPPMVLEHSWKLNGQIMSGTRLSEEEGWNV